MTIRPMKPTTPLTRFQFVVRHFVAPLATDIGLIIAENWIRLMALPLILGWLFFEPARFVPLGRESSRLSQVLSSWITQPWNLVPEVDVVGTCSSFVNTLVLPMLDAAGAELTIVNSTSQMDHDSFVVVRHDDAAPPLTGEVTNQVPVTPFWQLLCAGWLMSVLSRALVRGWFGWKKFFDKAIRLGPPRPTALPRLREANNNNNNWDDDDTDDGDEGEWFVDTGMPAHKATFATVDRLKRWLRGPCPSLGTYKLSWQAYWMLDVAIALGLVSVLRISSMLFVALTYLTSAIVFRLFWKRRRVTKKSRFEEASASKSSASPGEIRMWFAVYAGDIVLFTLLLPACAGYTLHAAVSPFFSDGMDGTLPSLQQFPPTFAALAAHWSIGIACLSVLMECESSLMPPIFAPGVDLHLMRSIRVDEIHHSWDFVLSQVYDVDFAKQIMDVVRVFAVDLISLYCVARIPALLLFQTVRLYRGITNVVGPPSDWTAASLSAAQRAQQLLLKMDAPIYFWEGTTWVVRVALIFGAVVAVRCASTLPLQHHIVAYMYPVARYFAVPLGLETFLFDKEQIDLLVLWISGDRTEPPPLPVVSVDRITTRRDRWLDAKDLPSFWRARVVAFTSCFFAVTYTVPLVIFTFSASFVMHCFGVERVLEIVALQLIFLAVAAAGLRSFVSYAIEVLLWPVFALVMVGLMLEPYCQLRWSTLAEELYEDMYETRRLVKKPTASPQADHRAAT